MPVMAYSPVGQGGALLRSKALAEVAARHGATRRRSRSPGRWRSRAWFRIPKAGDTAHVRQNAAAATLWLTEQDLAEIDAAFPPPRRKRSLEML